MGKMLVAVLGLMVLGAGAWLALNRAAERAATPPATTPPTAASPVGVGASAPKRQLDNVRGAAARIESDADARAQDLDSKMREN